MRQHKVHTQLGRAAVQIFAVNDRVRGRNGELAAFGLRLGYEFSTFETGRSLRAVSSERARGIWR
jgi:hypothetical protein